jgi:transposase
LLNAAAPQSNPVAHPTPTTPPALAFWTCPLCGGTMRVIERLTAAQIQLRSPPLPYVCAA